MYHKVILMEIKDDYCIAMTDDGNVIRIHKKEGMKVGDRIYVLDEDYYEKKVVKFYNNTTLHRMGLIAATLVIFITSLLFNFKEKKAYAVVSIDGNRSIQVELREDNSIKKIESFDGKMDLKEKVDFIGKDFKESKPELMKIAGSEKNAVIVAYGLKKKGVGEVEVLRDQIEEKSNDKVLYLEGNPNDIKNADKQDETLGIYLLKKIAKEDKFEEILEESNLEYMDLEELLELLLKTPVIKEKDFLRNSIDKRYEKINKEKPITVVIPVPVQKDDDIDDDDLDDDDGVYYYENDNDDYDNDDNSNYDYDDDNDDYDIDDDDDDDD